MNDRHIGPFTLYDIRRQAEDEIAAEDRRAAVDATKKLLRERQARPWWRVLFPFKITIRRL